MQDFDKICCSLGDVDDTAHNTVDSANSHHVHESPECESKVLLKNDEEIPAINDDGEEVDILLTKDMDMMAKKCFKLNPSVEYLEEKGGKGMCNSKSTIIKRFLFPLLFVIVMVITLALLLTREGKEWTNENDELSKDNLSQDDDANSYKSSFPSTSPAINIPASSPSSIDPANNDTLTQQSKESLYPSSSPSLIKEPSTTPSLEVIADPELYDVVIVGAGWAGLKAAETFLENKVSSVKILEAQDHVGGRSRTDLKSIPGIPIDLGSEWIFQGNTMFDYLSSKYDFDGSYMENSDFKNYDIFTNFMDYFVNYRSNLNQDIDVKTVLDEYDLDNDIDDLEENYIEAEFETSYAGDIEDLSVQETFKWWEYYEGYYLQDYVSTPKQGGFGKFVEDFASQFQNKIEVGAVVQDIEYGLEGKNTIRYRNSDGNIVILNSRRVLMTVSLGVLKAKSIKFIPSLPNEKEKVISQMGFGTVDKCVMYWDKTSFDDGDPIYNEFTKDWDTEWIPSASGATWQQFFNQRRYKGVNMITAWIGGNEAIAMESQDDHEIFKGVVNDLSLAVNAEIPSPSKITLTRWNQDKFTRGSYSYPIETRNHKEDIKTLKKPVGNLYFAGEATDEDWYATTVGAWRSGETVAKEIMKTL